MGIFPFGDICRIASFLVQSNIQTTIYHKYQSLFPTLYRIISGLFLLFSDLPPVFDPDSMLVQPVEIVKIGP